MHQQLFWFGVQLALVAGLRKAVVLKRGAHRPPDWCVEVGFGLLYALPLLAAWIPVSS
jgi:hypothetical protein